MPTGRTIGELGEFGLVDRITAALPTGRATLLGPGDDAAVVSTPDGRVVATTDLLVEGRHFRRDWSSAEDVGHKAAAQNLADVAAMGAVPTALLVGLAAPPGLDADWADGLARGLAAECATVQAAVVGGDVVRSDVLTVAVTALGDLEGRSPLTRAGARPGDVVAVAGRLGWAAAGLAVLSRGFRSPRAVVEAHRRPDVPYSAGPEAARLGAHALIDVSDGLVQDLGHVASASGVRIELTRAAVEVPEALQSVGAALNADPYAWLLAGGDDHALAGCFPADVQLPPVWTVLGSVVTAEPVAPGEPAVPGVLVDGAPWPDGGHDHFR